MASDKILVRLTEKSEQQLEEIIQKTGETNKTRIMNIAISLYHAILAEQLQSSKLLIEKEDGSRERIIVIGL